MFSRNEFTSDKFIHDRKMMRNLFDTVGEWDVPLVRKCEVDITGIELIASDHIRIKDKRDDINKTVHFFVEDSKIDRYYNYPDKYIERLAQYRHVLTPDYSLYKDMPMAIQIYNIFRSRWCGAYWQYLGLSVIPTISWSGIESFAFCFDGVESGSVVALSTLGTRRHKEAFLRGYFEMKEQINPKQVLCYGKGFPEMGDEVICVSYQKTTRRA